MARIIVFDPAPTPNPILEYLPSADTSQYITRTDVLIEPDLNFVAGFPMHYWKHEAGNILLMTLGERNDVDTAIADAIDLGIRTGSKARINNLEDIGLPIRALAFESVQEINALRQWLMSFKTETAASSNLADFKTRIAALPNMPDRTLAQVRTSIKNDIDNKVAD
jgi:hypothetical protein